MRRNLSLVAALAGVLALAAPALAITNGVPDANEHPYVAELLFYVPDAEDSRFDDPGGWFSCSGTLMSSTVLVHVPAIARSASGRMAPRPHTTGRTRPRPRAASVAPTSGSISTRSPTSRSSRRATAIRATGTRSATRTGSRR